MRLEEISAELYALDPSDFVAARDRHARTARADGDKALATEISRLRRPTLAAWAVNLLAHKATQELGALLDLGEALREAQQKLSADRMRTLTEQRRKAVHALTGTATRLAAEAGRQLAEPGQRAVAQTLTAALADPEVTVQVRAGVLSAAVDYAGFGPAGATLSAVSDLPDEAGAARAPEPAAAPDTAALDAAVEAVDTARAERDSARQEFTRQQAELTGLDERITALRAELERTENTRRFTASAADAAGAALRRAEHELERAREHLDRLRGD